MCPGLFSEETSCGSLDSLKRPLNPCILGSGWLLIKAGIQPSPQSYPTKNLAHLGLNSNKKQVILDVL